MYFADYAFIVLFIMFLFSYILNKLPVRSRYLITLMLGSFVKTTPGVSIHLETPNTSCLFVVLAAFGIKYLDPFHSLDR